MTDDIVTRLRADLDAYQKERDEEVVRLRAERDAEREAKQSAVDAAEAYRAERDAERHPKGTHHLWERIRTMTLQRNAARAERDALRALLTEARGEITRSGGAALTTVSLLARIGDALRTELAGARSEALEWNQNFSVAVEMRDKTMAERAALRAERDEFENSVSGLGVLADARCAEKGIVEDQLRAAEAERDALRALLTEARAALKGTLGYGIDDRARRAGHAALASIDAALKDKKP